MCIFFKPQCSLHDCFHTIKLRCNHSVDWDIARLEVLFNSIATTTTTSTTTATTKGNTGIGEEELLQIFKVNYIHITV